MVDSRNIKTEDGETKLTLSDQELDAPGGGDDVVENDSHGCDAPGDGDVVENESLGLNGQEGSADPVYEFQRSLKLMY